MQKILVTGAAGFIGFHVSRRLCADGYEVFGIDNLNNYYDPSLKQARLDQLTDLANFRFEKLDIEDGVALEKVFAGFQPDAVINLAAQAGVRYSLENPSAYISSNVTGFLNILECCRRSAIKHLIFASSSSVYGSNTRVPFSEMDHTDHPDSLYAATKKSNEVMAHSYAHLYGIPCTGLRFFTVYGPWGRPDMAYYLFTKALFAGEGIKLFNHGDMKRDFTYIGDIVEGIARLVPLSAAPNLLWDGQNPDPSTSSAPYRIYNIGNNAPSDLMDFIRILEKETGQKAKLEKLPMQPGDIYETCANVDALCHAVGFKPRTSLKKGLAEFVTWYKDYYKI